MMAELITAVPLPYEGLLRKRALHEIDLVVIHCTELPDLQTAREYGEKIHYPDSGTGNSGHVYVDRDGRAESWVALDRVAHHTRGHNERSVGIELVNDGRWPDWLHSEKQVMTDPYPEPQVEALLGVLEELRHRLPELRWIAGHDALDRERVPASNDPGSLVFRKRDPGPLFPWPRVLTAVTLKRIGDLP
jgi:N-acetylmuramoyl-L-alanine amidase